MAMGRDGKEHCCAARGISGLLGPSGTWALDCSKTSVNVREVKYPLVSHRDRSWVAGLAREGWDTGWKRPSSEVGRLRQQDEAGLSWPVWNCCAMPRSREVGRTLSPGPGLSPPGCVVRILSIPLPCAGGRMEERGAQLCLALCWAQ